MPTTSNFGWTTPADTDLVKDGAAAIRTLGNGIDTSFLDLKGGTTGQNLRKASDTDLDFTFAGDATNTVIDAEGDLLVGDSADTLQRLAIGTTGQVLTCDTTLDGKIKWAAPAAGGELTWTLLNAGGTALTGAQTITLSSVGGYDAYFILVIDASSANANASVIVRPNGSSTSTDYYHAGLINTPTSTYTIGTFAPTASYQGNANSMLLARTASNAGAAAQGSFIFWGGKKTGIKAWQAAGSGDNYGGADTWQQTVSNGLFNLTSVISSFDIRSSTGNWDAGTVYIFGGAI